MFTAVTDLPFADAERTKMVLRGDLRAMRDRAAVPAGQPDQILDWDTLAIEGPTVQTDPDGRSWFTYTGTAISRPLRPLEPPTT